MKIKEVLEGVEVISDIRAFQDLEIKGFKVNSKKVEKGDLFICLKGGNFDGNDYIDEALKNGASAVISETEKAGAICVKNTRTAYSLISKNFYGKACDRLKIIGVTGTNGKTTMTYMLSSIFESAGFKVATIGTLGVKLGDKTIDTTLTTPDPDVLHRLFADMEKAGVEYVFMEVSAHAIALKKLEGIKFETAVLTNITEDHLDFFENMDSYAKVKLDFMLSDAVKKIVVNCDDKYGRELLNLERKPSFSYGVESGDVTTLAKNLYLTRSDFIFKSLGKVYTISTNLAGEYNVSNALGAICVASIFAIKVEDIKKGLKTLSGVDGRFNVINTGKNIVVIDYAHTPDGLLKLLQNVRALTKGKIITVFGCGGNREKAKRSQMGKIAEDYSDYVCITSDNPRFEEPNKIIDEIEAGMIKTNHVKEVNRKDAIKKMLDLARKGDCIVIAGKGAEKTQEINGKKTYFSDYEEVRLHILDKNKEKL